MPTTPDLEARWAERDRAYERRRQEEEDERRQTPLVERLRETGPFRASDGIMSFAVGSYQDCHEAADRIEELEARLRTLGE